MTADPARRLAGLHAWASAYRDEITAGPGTTSGDEDARDALARLAEDTKPGGDDPQARTDRALLRAEHTATGLRARSAGPGCATLRHVLDDIERVRAAHERPGPLPAGWDA